MADVIINGMERPENCEDCRKILGCYEIGEDGAVWCLVAKGYIGDERTICPLRPAPEQERPITTNADHIRAGSNEHIAGVVCTGCPPGMETGKQCTEDGACYDCWLDWLKSPIRGDTDGSQ